MAKSKINSKLALDHLKNLCARGEKSPFEIEKKLRQWGLENKIEPFLAELMNDDFINPTRFAQAFARDKIKFNKWGKIKIQYYLKGHRIEDSIVEEALQQIHTEDYSLMIRKELIRKRNSLKISDPFQLKAKLYSFGNQRGYEPDILNRLLDNLNDDL